MKTSVRITILFIAMPFIYSCSEKAQDAKNAYDAVSNLTEIAKNMEKSMEVSNLKREERIRRGDTLSMPYQDLQQYLPATIAGYTAVETPTGSSMNMPGMSYSVGEQVYRKDNGYIKVNIMDYNGAYGLYTGAVAMYSGGFSMEDDTQRMQGLDLGMQDVKGWEVYMKKDKKASVFCGVGERFFITVEATNQENTELVKTIVKQINLYKLSTL